MIRLAILAALATVSFAQDTGPKPPAEVDQALRERITEFYKYHVTEEYRKAEKLVAEDSQDIYYIHNKPNYLSFEIKSIQYLDNFTKAKASVLCEQYIHGPGFEGKPVKMASTSTWKIENGKWMWYVDKDELAKTPFGKMANPGSKPGPGSTKEVHIPTSVDEVLGKVQLDQQTLEVKPKMTGQLTIANNGPLWVSVGVEKKLPGYEITFDKTSLNPGEKAVVTVKTNENPPAGEIAFRVSPLGEILVLNVKRN